MFTDADSAANDYYNNKYDDYNYPKQIEREDEEYE